MSEFERNETLRRSIRRPKKFPAPQPPTRKLDIPTEAPARGEENVSAIIKRLLISEEFKKQQKRDFVAPVPPVVLSAIPKYDQQLIDDDDDSSQSALAAIQHQINKIEFNSAVQRNKMMDSETTEMDAVPSKPSIRRTRYDEMESLLNTGISDVLTPNDGTPLDDEMDKDPERFVRGTAGRSSTGAVLMHHVDPKKVRPPRPVGRTASDTKQMDFVRTVIKRDVQRVIDGEKKADQVTE